MTGLTMMGTAGYMLSSSDGEDSDGEYIINPVTDMELPTTKVSTNDSLTLTAHRLAMIGRAPPKRRNKLGTLINLGLIAFLTVLLLFVDWCAWKIVRLPLEPFYLCRPFFISAVLVSSLGYLCVPLLSELRIHQNVWKEGPLRRSKKRASPTMGGLFFVPIGVGVAKYVAGFSSVEVTGTAVATLAFATIGLLDDIVTVIKNRNSGLSVWVENIFGGSCWDLLFILVAYHKYIITLQHVYILVTNLINTFLMENAGSSTCTGPHMPRKILFFIDIILFCFHGKWH
ncbi:hypothetical protein OIU78_024881 [Salix suchowensis]|nr:hypothetical protein OIU78_024881 [Salix suchowensis]